MLNLDHYLFWVIAVTQFMVAYGWYVLVLAAVAYYLWRTKVRPALRQLHTSTQVAAHKKYGE